MTPDEVGCASKYRAEYCAQARELVMAGATMFELGRSFGVSRTTIWHWTCKFPEFRDAIKFAKEPADERVERALFERAHGYSYEAEKIHVTKEGDVIRVPYIEHVPPSETAMIFWLKNRKPQEYRDKREEIVDANVTIKVVGGLKDEDA